MLRIFLEKLVQDPAGLRGAGKGICAIGGECSSIGIARAARGHCDPGHRLGGEVGFPEKRRFEEGVAKKMVSRATS
jgi:hypothetical protein